MARRGRIEPAPRRPPVESGPEPRARTVAPMGVAMEAFLHRSGLGARLRDQRVFDAWSQVLGAELARRARPARFRGGELLVEVESSAHLGELESFTGEQFRREANRRLGGERIERVVFKLKR